MTASLIAQRVESDRFGDCSIPEGVLWGIQTARSMENLSFSSKKLSGYARLIANLSLVKKAAAEANCTTGALDPDYARVIFDACDEIESGKHNHQFPVDMLHGGGSIAFNVNINEVIANLANMKLGKDAGSYEPVRPKDHVNASQSTADVCHTAFRLSILDLHDELDERLDEMVDTLRHLKGKLSPVNTVSRTCLQDAMPVSLGELFGGYASLMERRRFELTDSVDALKAVNLGGTVIGSGESASDNYKGIVVPILSRLTDYELRHRSNLFDAAENIDDLGNVSSQLKHLAQALLKIASDLRLLSSGPEAGFSELFLPKVQEGSSFFSMKNNPVIPETVINCCLQVLGCDRSSQAALEKAELYLNVFENVAATNIMDAIMMLTSAIDLFSKKCLNGIEANLERCQSYAQSAARNR